MLMLWIFSQLLAYTPYEWAAFAAITFTCGYFGRGVEIPIGLIIVTTLVIWSDLQWIQSAINAPDWNGAPDQDGIFIIGMIIRIVLVNTTLFPLTLLTLWFAFRQRKRRERS